MDIPWFQNNLTDFGQIGADRFREISIDMHVSAEVPLRLE